MQKLSNIWLFSDLANRLPELVNAANTLAEKVSVFVLGDQQQVDQALALGVNQVHYLGEQPTTRITEDYAETIAHTLQQNEAPLVLLPATKRGKTLAAKLAIKLNAGVVNDVNHIDIEQGIKAAHMTYGGMAISEEQINSNTAILTLSNGAFPAAQPTAVIGEVVNVDYIAPAVAITCIERRAKQASSVDLNKAKRVIGIGSGIGSKENLVVAAEVASMINAELGCSRPIAETEKWMDRERYIGVSGVMLKPEIYFALGISGQIQHMVGVNSAQTIFAVNRDKNAPIFQQVDYGLIGDINKVLPALINALKA
ncbi:FAD-binding protein [Shewanella marina]|uniref:FAD-binding protein n=1 Tax=Shewanella marina TaxID=487319 RepID=UPI00047001FA|nr:FAD-binding protein [Shewanella marina]